MKKSFLTLAVASVLALTACGQEATTEETTAVSETETSQPAATTAATTEAAPAAATEAAPAATAETPAVEEKKEYQATVEDVMKDQEPAAGATDEASETPAETMDSETETQN